MFGVLLITALAQEPTTFDERHPLGSLDEMVKRFRWSADAIRKKDPDPESRMSDESFRVLLPADHDPKKTYGLLVWVSPGPGGHVSHGWKDALAKRSIIAVGADNSGNDRDVWHRVALALHAVHNMSKRHSIDPKRTYVAGFSGGGRIASRCALAYPDVFAGGIYMGGMDFYKDIRFPDDPKRVWPAMLPPPKDDLLRKVKKESRHAIVVGDQDFNRAPSKAMADAMKKTEGFANVAYLEMPGTGHAPADAATLEKALDVLDAPPAKK